MLGKRGPIVVAISVAVAATAAVATAARLVGIKTEINPISMRYFARTGTNSIEKAR
jgi:hypothetical protein